jgi:DNA-binding LytR/AlgR family response regulator
MHSLLFKVRRGKQRRGLDRGAVQSIACPPGQARRDDELIHPLSTSFAVRDKIFPYPIEEVNPMLRIAVCDDMPDELERADKLLKKYASEHPQYEVKIYSFSAPLEMLTYVERQGGFDALLLDVYMPGILGTDAARELRELGDNCQLIFLTTSRDHAVDAFSLDAAHYLVKPYSEKEFFAALDKAFNSLAQKRVTITIKSTDGIRSIELDKLVYAEASNHLQRLYLSDGGTVCVRKSSTELFELLEEEPRFYKCGSTYIINMDYIVELTSGNVAFSTGSKIPILSRKYADFKRRYMDYVCNR